MAKLRSNVQLSDYYVSAAETQLTGLSSDLEAGTTAGVKINTGVRSVNAAHPGYHAGRLTG
jgi:hypothetical protein